MDEEELQDDLRVFPGRSVLPPWLRSFPAVYLALALSSLLLLLLSSLALARVSSISSQLQQELLGRNFSDRDSFLFPCGPDSREWEYFAGNCYYFSLARLSWGRARERCRERRAQLVVIGSFPEQQFLMSRTRNERFWIGLTDENSEGKWEWVDGSDYGSAFTFWGEGEPNDSGSSEDCAHLWLSGRWNDVRCSFECFFISSGMKPEAAPSCLEQKTPLPEFAVIPNLCSGCGSLIRDRFLLRVNERSWHERCLRCCACGLVLAGNSCFSRECRIYCRHDYLRLFPRRCSRCRGALGGSERIQKVLEFLFHERCLRCCSCSRRLRSGDRFVLRHGRILCPREPEFPEFPGNPARSEEEEEEEEEEDSRNCRDFSGKDPKRSKRPRTVLSWQQRRAFRESFRISAKPCRKVRESLAAQTGLTVRVVQVWFQNQRAKMKKLARRQQQEQLGNSRGEIPEGRRGRDRERDEDEEGSGIFQEPPGDAPGSTENSQRSNLGNGGIPGIPEPGNPLERLHPGIPEPGNALERLHPGIPGIPEFGNPLERLYPGIPGIPEFGNPLERLHPRIPGIPEPGNALERLHPGIPGIPEPGNALEQLHPGIPGIPEFGNPLERLHPGIPGIPEFGNPLERLHPGIPEFGNPLERLHPGIPGIPDPRNSLEWPYPRIPGIPGIPEPGNPMERLFSMESSYFTS